MTTRRHFLQSAVLSAAALGRVRGEAMNASVGPDDPAVRVLALRALDAARSAGASYADVRITADRTRAVDDKGVKDSGYVYVGVRALRGVAGAWGFASSGECTADSVVRLAREAVTQATVNTWGMPRTIPFDAVPTATGTWQTPIQRDPFAVAADEMLDWVHAVSDAPERLGLTDVTVRVGLAFRRQVKVFASTSGAFQTQTLHWTGQTDLSIDLEKPLTQQRVHLDVPFIPLRAGGYDTVATSWIDDQLVGWVNEARQQFDSRAIAVGRYDVVLDAATTAAVIRSTIGYAAELDRIHGEETNAGGTSYLAPKMLGTPIAVPQVSITASRSLPNGPASVGWDDEGVVPSTFDLVRDGVLMDFVTSRAYASALTDWYTRRGQSVQSHGCAMADTAADLPLTRPPDLTLVPGTKSAQLTDLIANVSHGVAVLRGDCAMDRRQATGQIFGELFEIRNGRLGSYLGQRVLVLFKSTELWKNIVTLGGPSSAVLRGFTAMKGQPGQQAMHGVFAVPMTVRDMAVVSTL